MKKVLLIATVQSHICQFHRPLVEILKKHGFEVHVAARNNLSEKNGLSIDFVDKVYNIKFRRSPFSIMNVLAARALNKVLDENDYSYIHANTPVGGVIGRICANKCRKNGAIVLYTAHGFHFYKKAPLYNWLFYYPVEKLLSKITDKIITISSEDYEMALHKLGTNVFRIHGAGVDIKRFHPLGEEQIALLKNEFHIPLNKTIILVVGELNKNKNQITILKAMKILEEKNFILLIAGNGPRERFLKDYVENNYLQDCVSFLGYRKDIQNYTMLADIIVSCSKREGLGLNIIEGMLCKKKVYASYNRGHNELLRGINQFEFNDYIGLAALINNHMDYSHKLIDDQYELALKYSFENVKNELESIYFD